MVMLLRALQSEHMRHVPSFLGTKITGTTQGLILSLTQHNIRNRTYVEDNKLVRNYFKEKIKARLNMTFHPKSHCLSTPTNHVEDKNYPMDFTTLNLTLPQVSRTKPANHIFVSKPSLNICLY